MSPIPRCRLSIFKLGGNDYVAITRDNADIIECILSFDATYSGGTGVNAKPNKRFGGSLAYWQNWANKIFAISSATTQEKEYKRFVDELVEVVDRSNATHLTAAINGRGKTAKRITTKCKTLQDLKNELSKDPFIAKNGIEDVDPNHILHKLSEPLPSKKGSMRCNISFASKFCQFASKILGASYEYSKYDNIVSKALPAYINKYLNIKYNSGYFLTGGKSLSEKTRKYAKYCNCIDKILEKVNAGKSNSQQISREEFDHIVWYTNK